MFNLIRRVESRVLLLLISLAGALWGFEKLAGEVMEGDTEALDHRVLLMLRNPVDPADPIGSRTFEEAMRDVTALGGFTVVTLVTVVAVVAFLLHRRPRHALILAVTVGLASLSTDILKAVYARPRPDLVPHGSYVYSGSFPSGHSTSAAAMYFTLAMLIASLELHRGGKLMVYLLSVLIVLWIGFSRVYLGVHWPSDVLAGWSLGAAWALAAWMVLRLVGHREDIVGKSATAPTEAGPKATV